MPRLYGTDRIRIEHVISSRRLAIVKLEKSSQMAPNFISTVVLFIFSRAHIIRSILISFYSGPFISLYARNKVLSFSRRERGVILRGDTTPRPIYISTRGGRENVRALAPRISLNEETVKRFYGIPGETRH